MNEDFEFAPARDAFEYSDFYTEQLAEMVSESNDSFDYGDYDYDYLTDEEFFAHDNFY